jgi:rhamnose utilization protein RhaD (predicted bifunctional aldolase and dehydrogenase)
LNTSLILSELIQLSHELGLEERQLVILGEGNLSADCGDGTFWVKASGSSMVDIDETGFSRVRFEPVLELSLLEDPTEQQVINGLKDSLVTDEMRQPSIETFLHAICLHETEAQYIAHTHPTSVLSILCSKLGAEPLMNHIFPEPIPICGRAPAIVPYTDPGFKLAHAVRQSLQEFRDAYGETPKIMLMINHGLVALAKSSQEALKITRIADKWARIVLATYPLGGPNFLTSEQINRFAKRLDEEIRQGQ